MACSNTRGVVYARAIYEETYLTEERIGKKMTKVLNHRLVQGPAIHSYRIKDPQRAAIFTTLVMSAAILNQAILAIVEQEEPLQYPVPVKKKRRKNVK